MIRLFVAIGIPEDVADQLPMPDGAIGGVNWVPDENFHVTLRFIGEVDNARARDIDDVLSAIREPEFELHLHGLDTFGGKKPHALFAGVRPCPALVHLHQKVDAALTRLGHPGDRTRYTPHVTLARLRHAPEEKLAAFIQGNNLFECDPFAVTEFGLYSSELHADGSVYTLERSYPLSTFRS
jgi:RNA 2',3'-cyclic 3'-phosphodiesterase